MGTIQKMVKAHPGRQPERVAGEQNDEIGGHGDSCQCLARAITGPVPIGNETFGQAPDGCACPRMICSFFIQ